MPAGGSGATDVVASTVIGRGLGPAPQSPRTFPALEYMGSFPVVGPDQATRAELVRAHLQQLRVKARTKSVLLVVSLAGIKVCSPDGKSVYMAHALRRISYATCEPEHAQFSFLAREPSGHFSLQYCHSFLTTTSDQAEELNSIVGNAFRMAYAAQLQRQQQQQQQQQPASTLREVIASQLHHLDLVSDKDAANRSSAKKNIDNCWTSGKGVGSPTGEQKKLARQKEEEEEEKEKEEKMNVQVQGTAGSPLRLQPSKVVTPVTAVQQPQPPNSIPGLRPVHHHQYHHQQQQQHHHHHHHQQQQQLSYNVACDNKSTHSQQSTPSSDESNSPTELNSYKRLADKPPLIKRLAMGLSSAGVVAGGGVGSVGSVGLTTMEDDSCPLMDTPSSTPGSSPAADAERAHLRKVAELLQGGAGALLKCDAAVAATAPPHPRPPSEGGVAPTPPPLPERTDSLTGRGSGGGGGGGGISASVSASVSATSVNACTAGEQGELRAAPWFQAGIPREITLEVLGREPVGAFMVRDSTSKPGCYALSLRVPRDFQPTGIAHYLIMRTNKGFKIKGFTKEFTTLTALITHHSVMPELLPCPLSLSRYNPTFAKTDTSRDFADVDSDPDYNTLADFRKMMADLNV